MSSVLDSVEWGKPALSLLSHSRELNPGLPAVMHIRHSERPFIHSRGELGANLTESGKRASYEFGSRLPRNRSYRLYYTDSGRVIETAEKIHQGLKSINAESHIGGEFLKSHHDQEKIRNYIVRDVISKGEKTGRSLFINWAGGHFPPWEMEPCGIFAQRAALVMLKNLKELDSSGFDIYVSHDIWIDSLFLYWCGIMLSTDCEFLDGFILQLKDDRMNVYFKDGKKEAYYPYWWNF